MKLSLRSATKVTTIPTSTTLVPSMTTTARRRRLELDVDIGRAMSEWSLGFEVADNGVSVGEETTIVRWRRNHKKYKRRHKAIITQRLEYPCPLFSVHFRSGHSGRRAGFRSGSFGYGFFGSKSLRPIG
ncbi:unnamed protein product [Brassica napus]|uniref:(rape) hypothetical protein n=1 Tax=Brassica napus TaxID=3708 RepID=A0A816VTE6_BRANA|nr:unnamed protein product [Brassica napus]